MVCVHLLPLAKSKSGVTFSSGPPTQGRTYQKLVEEERVLALAGQKPSGNGAQLINTALKLEHDRLVILLVLRI